MRFLDVASSSHVMDAAEIAAEFNQHDAMMEYFSRGTVGSCTSVEIASVRCGKAILILSQAAAAQLFNVRRANCDWSQHVPSGDVEFD